MNYKSIGLMVLALVVFASCKKEGTSVIQRELTADEKARTNALIEEATNPEANATFASITFSEIEHDFGIINPNDVVETVFTLTNTGQADLVIANATGSCGCTVPEYPKTPIAPGQKAEIKVSFDPKGKMGMQNKTVTLNANTAAGVEILTIKANIVK